MAFAFEDPLGFDDHLFGTDDSPDVSVFPDLDPFNVGGPFDTAAYDEMRGNDLSDDDAVLTDGNDPFGADGSLQASVEKYVAFQRYFAFE